VALSPPVRARLAAELFVPQLGDFARDVRHLAEEIEPGTYFFNRQLPDRTKGDAGQN
jgi:hypothetical protein